MRESIFIQGDFFALIVFSILLPVGIDIYMMWKKAISRTVVLLLVPQLGRVILEDDVEVGANATFDRGSVRDTVIGAGSRLDNLVQIGHNVVLGRCCVVVGGDRNIFNMLKLVHGCTCRCPAGQSGLHFISVTEKLGIAEQVKAKGKTIPGGAAAEFIAKGDADMAIQLIPELASVPGVEIVGPFPPELQSYIVLTAGLGSNARDKAGAQALIKYLTTPAAITVIKAKGMEPG